MLYTIDECVVYIETIDYLLFSFLDGGGGNSVPGDASAELYRKPSNMSLLTRYHSEHVINLYTLCHLCDEVVCVGSMCWNHPELVRIRSSDRLAVV